MDPGGFLLPEVSIFCHRPDEPPTNNADVPAGRQLSISIDSLVRLMLHKEPLEVQDRLASKAIALLQPETFVAPTGLSLPFVYLNQLPTVAKRLIAIFIDDDEDDSNPNNHNNHNNEDFGIVGGGRGVAFLPFRELQAAASDLWAATDILFNLLADIAHEHGLDSQNMDQQQQQQSISSRICIWGQGGRPQQQQQQPSSSSSSLTSAPRAAALPKTSLPSFVSTFQSHNHGPTSPPAGGISTASSCAPVLYNGSVYIALYPAITYINGNTSTDADARRWFNRAKPHLRPSAERGDDLPNKISGLPGQTSRTRYSSFAYLNRIITDGSFESIIPKERLQDPQLRFQRWKQVCAHVASIFGPASIGNVGVDLEPPAAKRPKLETAPQPQPQSQSQPGAPAALAPASALAPPADLSSSSPFGLMGTPNYGVPEDENTFSLLQRLDQQMGDQQQQNQHHHQLQMPLPMMATHHLYQHQHQHQQGVGGIIPILNENLPSPAGMTTTMMMMMMQPQQQYQQQQQQQQQPQHLLQQSPSDQLQLQPEQQFLHPPHQQQQQQFSLLDSWKF